MKETVSDSASGMRAKIYKQFAIINDQIAKLEQNRFESLDESAKLKYKIKQFDKFQEWKKGSIERNLKLLPDYGKEYELEVKKIQEREGRIQLIRDSCYGIEEECAVLTADIERLRTFRETAGRLFDNYVMEKEETLQDGYVLPWSELTRAGELFKQNDKSFSTMNSFVHETDKLIAGLGTEINKFEEHKSSLTAYLQHLTLFLEGMKKGWYSFLMTNQGEEGYMNE